MPTLEQQQMMNQQQQVEAQQSQSRAQEIQSYGNATTLFQGNEEPNLIEFQLEMDSILESLDISLRGKVLKEDQHGSRSWQVPEDKRNVVFSELGAQEILRFLSQYLNRNLILSSYKADDVPKRIINIANELNDILFLKYETIFYTTPISELKLKLGYLDYEDPTIEDMKIIIDLRRNELREKVKNYSIAILPVVHAIESSYNRSVGGEERRSLRQHMMVTQTGQMGGMQQQQVPRITSRKSLWNPFTWGA